MSTDKVLNKVPLVEAIFEVKWELKRGRMEGTKVDPHYQLLPGRLFDKVKDKYPFHESLPSESIPDEFSPHTVKQRFRKRENQWPLIQIGPGIMSFNETQKYTTYEIFRPRAVESYQYLIDVYPEPLSINSLLLRYIDAFEFDYEQGNVFDFLTDKLNFPVSVPPDFLEKENFSSSPSHFFWQSSFRCENPKGMSTLKIATGLHKSKKSIICEQIVHSIKEDIDKESYTVSDDIEKWLDSAHDIIHKWFFLLISGELEKELCNE